MLQTYMPPSLGQFSWPKVNVSQGWYVFTVNITGFLASSPRFFVANGTDQTCIGTLTPSPSPSMLSDNLAITDDGTSSKLIIVIIFLGVWFLISLVILMVWCNHRRKRNQRRSGTSNHNRITSRDQMLPMRSLRVQIPSAVHSRDPSDQLEGETARPVIELPGTLDVPVPSSRLDIDSRAPTPGEPAEFRATNNITPAYPSGLSIMWSPVSLHLSQGNDVKLYNLQDPTLPGSLGPELFSSPEQPSSSSDR